LGCWMGKNIGGTLGAPFEWKRQINDVSFYTQDLGGEPLPNDDLDIQLLWLVALEEMGVDLDAHTLADYWCLYVTPHWSEYGTAKTNMRQGLLPALSGTVENDYKHSCGCFIRSEIWACIAPGCPEIAARYAREDAILDHGNGEGTYGEVFCAALESAAFVVDDLRALIDIGLSYIPEDCGVAGAVRCAVDAFDAGKSWREARDDILRDYRGGTFMGQPDRTSPEDREKAFHTGRRGYDAPSNVAIVVLGLLYGADDFDEMICTTVNCGEDTDCTGATAGAIFGIIHGIDAIPERWIEPIGRSIKTACLNLGELGYFGNQLPDTIDELTDRTERMAEQILARHRFAGTELSRDEPTDLEDLSPDALKAPDGGAGLYEGAGGTVHRFDFFTVIVDYGSDPTVRNGETRTVRLTIENNYKTQANISMHWYLPDGWEIWPGRDAYVMSLPGNLSGSRTLEFALRTDEVRQALTRFVVELTIEGRPTVMLVPVMLLNGNGAGPVAQPPDEQTDDGPEPSGAEESR
ncbi:MAG: ADP-ribosylglycohydrolase family protein, partial [Candidatus Brocadiia bacterium]